MSCVQHEADPSDGALALHESSLLFQKFWWGIWDNKNDTWPLTEGGSSLMFFGSGCIPSLSVAEKDLAFGFPNNGSDLF